MKKYLQVGERIKKLRGDISQEEFAKRIGVSFRGYQNYESGKRIPHPHTLYKIAELCGTTVDWIITGDLNVEKARVIERAKSAFHLQDIAEELEKTIRREEKLLYAGLKEQSEAYGIDESRLTEKKFLEALRGWISQSEHEEHIRFWTLSDSTKKLIDNLLEILESGNEVMVDALKANIRAFLEAVRTAQKKNDPNEKGEIKNEKN